MTKHGISISEYYGLTKNSIWVVFSNLSMVFILALTIVASRTLGDVVFGQYTFLLAITTVLADFSVLGTTDYVGVLAARKSDQTGNLVANTLGLRIPVGILFLVVCVGIAKFTVPDAVLASFFIALDWLVRTVIHLLRTVLRSRDMFQHNAQVAIIERFAVLIFAGGMLLLGGTLTFFTLGFLIGRLIGLFANFRAYRRLDEQIRVSFTYAEWRKILRGGFPIGVRGMLKGISFRVDAIILGFLRPSYEVGWYGAAYKFLEAGFFFQEAVNSSVQPAISRAYGQNNRGLAGDLYGRGYKVLLIIGGLVATIGFTYADYIVNLIYGSEYMNSAIALKVLVWPMILIYGSMTSLILLDAVESGSKTVIPFALSTLVNIVLNVMLIPHLGFLGAALTTLLTEMLLTVVLLYTSFQSGYRFPLAWLYSPIIACVGATVVNIMFSSLLFLGPLLALSAFIIILITLGAFDETDFEYGRLILHKVTRKIAALFGVVEKLDP